MLRFLTLAALVLSLAACDATAPDSPTAQLTVGATYDGTEMAFRDQASGDVAFDFLAAGAEISFTFVDATRFTARLFVPESALRASGETDDVDGDFDAVVSGTYTQTNGALSFTADPWVDSLFDDSGWTVDVGGQAARYVSDADRGLDISIVLTRR